MSSAMPGQAEDVQVWLVCHATCHLCPIFHQLWTVVPKKGGLLQLFFHPRPWLESASEQELAKSQIVSQPRYLQK